jgi:hypothetical protein
MSRQIWWCVGALVWAISLPVQATGEDYRVPPDQLSYARQHLDLQPFHPSGLEYHFAGTPEPVRQVIMSPSEWTAFWKEKTHRASPQPPVPPIDFDRYVVLYATMGEFGGYGHSIWFLAAVGDSTEVSVTVLELSAGAGCLASARAVRPCALALLSKTSATIGFETVHASYECPW